MSDPRIDRERMTPDRERQAKLNAASILRTYGPDKAVRRANEIAAGIRDLSPGNKAFYQRVEDYVREGVEHGTVDGKKISWR